MKKLTSLLLAALLALSSSATVFAESIPVQSEEYPLPAPLSEELSVSVDEYADSIPVESEELPPLAITPDEPTEFPHVCDVSCVEDFIEIELTDEEFEQLDAVAAEQQALIASTQSNTGKASILDQYDFSTDYYYNQLSAGEKKIYDGIIKLFEDVLDSTADLTDNNTNIDTSYLGSVTIDISITKDRLYDILRAAYYANPRLYHFSTTRSTASDLSRIGVYIKDEYLTYAARVDTEKKLAAATTEYMTAVNKCSTDYEKATLISQMLCDNIVYDLEAQFDQTVHGALIDKLCVCNGFAMAYTFLCNAAGIECIGYRNHPHAWNKVKIGGSWYETDVTWMNNDTYGFYNYKYLMNSYEGVRSGNDSHEIDEYSTPSLTLPSCPTPYDHGFDTGTAKNVKVESVNGYLRVTWDEVKGASGYRVSRNDGVATTVLGQNYYIDNSDDLVVGTKYTYCVNPYVYGWNGYSDWASWVTHVKAVPAQNVTATYSSGKVNVKWDAVPYATEYYVWRAAYEGDWEKIGTVKTNAYTDTTFIGGNQYRYCVSARADGVFVTYGYMNGYVQTVSTKPANIKAVAGNGQVKLTWDKVTGATKYCVAIYNASTKKYTIKTDTLTTNSYTVTGLANGTTYQFLVQAYAYGAWSKFTTADHVSATPVGTTAKPTNIKATAGDGKVTLTWDKVTGATKYCVALYNASTKKYTVKTNTLTTNSYTVTGLTNGTTYYFLVQAYANGAWSKFTTADHVSATPVGASTTKPTNIKATAGDGKVTLTWDKVTGATKYCVALYNASTKKYTVKTNTLTTNSYTVTGLTNGTTYYFLVQAYANGAWSKFTTADHVSATPVGASTTKPTNIKTTAGDGKVTLTWDKVTGATKYCVALYNASTKKYTIKTNTLTTNSYTVTGLTNGTTYYFLVQSYANGAWSKFTTADHVSATPVAATAKPTNIKAVAGNGKVTLTWDKVTGATKYCVALYDASTKKYTIKTNTLTTNSYTVTGLTNGTTYYFLVQAYANGAWSKFTTADHVSATPKA